jgi:hypothetical protein
LFEKRLLFIFSSAPPSEITLLSGTGASFPLASSGEAAVFSISNAKTFVPVVRDERAFPVTRDITVMADRGMVSQATLEAFEKSDPPVRYILGVRMRRQKEVNSSVLSLNR